MKVIKNVVVKQLLTDASKQLLIEKFQSQVKQIANEIEQLRFEKKKFEKAVIKTQNPNITKQLEKEIQSRADRLKSVQFKVDQLDLLPIGSELKETEVQTLVEVNEGDNWEELMKGGTIIIKDGIVHEIR